MVDYRDPGPIEFEATLQKSSTVGASAYLPFPFDVSELFGVAGRVPVIAHFEGIEYRGSLITYGGPHLMLMLREIREKLGKEPGDTVTVRIELDTSPRTVEPAQDVTDAFAEAGVLGTFEDFTYSSQREYNDWIEGAKKPQTRSGRIQKAIALLTEGKRLK